MLVTINWLNRKNLMLSTEFGLRTVEVMLSVWAIVWPEWTQVVTGTNGATRGMSLNQSGYVLVWKAGISRHERDEVDWAGVGPA